MSRRKLSCLLVAAVPALILTCAGAFAAWDFFRPQPAPKTETIFEGVEYHREVSNSPREMVVHVVIVDLQADGVRVLVTPGDPQRELPLDARTTSHFLTSHDVQVAVNGDAFEPWTANGPFDYYPHPGDPVDVIGYAASQGTAYSDAHPTTPTLYFSQTNNARFHRPFSNVQNAISGTEMLVENGRVVASQDGSVAPRTAVGLNRAGRTLILVVVDGRQPGYSLGATLPELAEILLAYGAHDAMNLDGGGSSTLVREGPLGNAVLLNHPIDRSIPGWERAVGNHLGIFARRTEQQ